MHNNASAVYLLRFHLPIQVLAYEAGRKAKVRVNTISAGNSFSFAKKVNKSSNGNLAEQSAFRNITYIQNSQVAANWKVYLQKIVLCCGFINLAALVFLCHPCHAHSCVIWAMHLIYLHRSIGKPGCESYWVHREDDRVFLCQCTTAKGTISRSNFPSFSFTVYVSPVSKEDKNRPSYPSMLSQNGITCLTDEVGNTAAFLASQLASAVTGSTIYVDNGLNTMGLALDSRTLST